MPIRTVLIAALTLLVAAAPVSAATLGQRVLKKGHRGKDVFALQRVLSLKGYSPGPTDGVFGGLTKRAVKQFQRSRGLTRDGIVGPATVAGFASNWRVRTATYYGPGLWGNRTACGHTLRKRTYGVAHRSLPCGHLVPVYRRGLLAIYPVIDRGPYTDGISLDLTAAAARKVGMSTTSKVRAGY
jgi:rare lipoprotein A (peptidoglycan hydrolase)